MIKAILFDFDGILTTDRTGSLSICKYISKKTGIDYELFKKEYYKYNADLLYGKVKHEDIWEVLCSGLNRKIDINVLYESFLNTSIDNQMIELACKLKEQNYKIGMVTDNKKDRIDNIIKHYDWDKLFDTITISSEVGSGKDCKAIFERTIDSLKVTMDECVFIDNQEKNLIIPRSMGMKVIYFNDGERNYDELVQKLKELSVKIIDI